MPATINSDDGVVSGSAGLKTTGANDGILALQNNGTTNVTVTAAGNVGIKTTSPAGLFHVQGSVNQGRFYIDSTATVYTIDSNDDVARGKSLYFRYCGDGVNRALIFTDGTLAFQTGAGGLSAALPGGTTQYPAFFARAWVNFNGTGTVAIRTSGNVTSITDNGTGSYTANFTTAMPDANFSANVSMQKDGGTGNETGPSLWTRTASSIQVLNVGYDNTFRDSSVVCISVFR